MTAGAFSSLEREKYISLETFRKNGQGVKTPVWFVLRDDVVYVYTEGDSGKAKRIRHNPRVQIAPCTIRGAVTGPWSSGTATFVEGEERRAADTLLNRKYWIKVLAKPFTRFSSRPRVMIRITPA